MSVRFYLTITRAYEAFFGSIWRAVTVSLLAPVILILSVNKVSRKIMSSIEGFPSFYLQLYI